MHRPKGEIINVTKGKIALLQGDQWLTMEEKDKGDDRWSTRGKPPAEWKAEWKEGTWIQKMFQPKEEINSIPEKKKEKKGKENKNKNKENVDMNKIHGPVKTLYPKAGVIPPTPTCNEERKKEQTFRAKRKVKEDAHQSKNPSKRLKIRCNVVIPTKPPKGVKPPAAESLPAAKPKSTCCPKWLEKFTKDEITDTAEALRRHGMPDEVTQHAQRQEMKTKWPQKKATVPVNEAKPTPKQQEKSENLQHETKESAQIKEAEHEEKGKESEESTDIFADDPSQEAEKEGESEDNLPLDISG